MATSSVPALNRQSPTFMQAVWPERTAPGSNAAKIARGVTLAVVFSLLIGVSAHVSFFLPFTPVPVTLQTFAVLFTGALLGSRLGTATLALYIIEGVAGLPVFAPGNGPFADGYLAGFVVAAFVVGLLAERRWDRNPFGMAAIMAIGSAIIYFFGVIWLSIYVHGLSHVLYEGMIVFLPGDAAKAALAAVLLPTGWKLLGSRRG